MPERPATDLLIRLDTRRAGSAEGLQRQIATGIRQAVLDGRLAPGSRLASTRALAEDLAVSRTTTLLALDQLVAEGYLTARRGAGTYVAEQLPSDLRPPRAPRAERVDRPPALSRIAVALLASPPGGRRFPGRPRAFRIGTPAVDLFPVETWSRLVSRRLRSVKAADLDYGDVSGAPELREAVAAHVRSARGTRCTSDQVLIVAGVQQGLELLCRMLLDPGDRVWMEEPGYPGARSAFLAPGASPVPVAVDDEGLDDRAGARRAPDAKMVYVTPSHQYPLGVTMSLSRRLELVRWAREARAWVIEDDYDSEFRYGARPIPCLHGLDRGDRVLYVGSFSKTLFPALRLGFVIVPPALRERLVAVRAVAEQHPPALDQQVLADFMEEGHFARHLKRMRAIYAERLAALEEAAASHCAGALSIRPAHTGLHVVADLVDADAERVAAEAAARGVEVAPVGRYYARTERKPAPGRRGRRDALVLGFGSVDAREIDRGMAALAEAIEAAPHR